MEQQKGFTILEVIIAAFILVVGIGGAFTLIQQNLSVASISKNRLIAINLVNEGLESVRGIRDSNFIAILKSVPAINWDDNGIKDCDINSMTNPSSCQFVCVNAAFFFPGCSALTSGFLDFKLETYQGNVLQADPDEISPNVSSFRLRRPPLLGLTPTMFTREILIEELGVDEVEVTVQVFGTQKGIQRTVKATTKLYNWIP